MNLPSSGRVMFSQSDQYGGRSAGVMRSGTSALSSWITMYLCILQADRLPPHTH